MAAFNNAKSKDSEFRQNLAGRQRTSKAFGSFFFISNFVGIFVLGILLLHVANSTYGLVVIRNTVEPATLADVPIAELSEPELAEILVERLGGRIRVIFRDRLSRVAPEDFTTTPISIAFEGTSYPEEYADGTINDMPPEAYVALLVDNFSQQDLVDLIETDIVRPIVSASWTFLDSINRRAEIEDIAATRYPDDRLEWRGWISLDFITSSVSSSATTAGLRTALLGSFWIISITAPLALIIGVSAAIYLEEYARDNWVNRLIAINIRTLAGIPSVIYGMLGLAVFAQALSVFTGGYFFGVNLPNRSPEQVISVIYNSFDIPAMDNLLLQDVAEVAKGIRNDNDFVDFMVRQIPTEALTEQEKANLVRAFVSLRRVDPVNPFAFSSPSPQLLTAKINAAFDTSILPEEKLVILQDGLRLYGTFNINGRTVTSAAITLALLILPIIIVNAQEALRAVPSTIREASYGLGATKWQTVARQILPTAFPSILTGVILAVSRAIGETAPLLVVGASTFIGIDPNGPFSKFTVVPIQIYQWTSRPEQEFKNVAAAAIIVLLVVMLMLNAIAIILRNRFSRRF